VIVPYITTGCRKNPELSPKKSEKSHFRIRHYMVAPPGDAVENLYMYTGAH